jgi:Transcription factor/nuclear export subunit protein 2
VIHARRIAQYCICPRLALTPADALYCAKFAHTLHALGTPCFSSLHYFDKVRARAHGCPQSELVCGRALRACAQVVKEVTPTLLCSTEREAINLGVFLKVGARGVCTMWPFFSKHSPVQETLGQLNTWYASEAVYARECSTQVRARCCWPAGCARGSLDVAHMPARICDKICGP